MVSRVKTKNRKSPSVQLDYVITIIEIKPWPPSQSLRSLRSALIQWEHGDKNSGTTKAVTPLLVPGATVGDGKIEFNESFKLHVTLLREMSIKSGDSDTFLKNCIEFNMYEPRRDKTVKGQLLATAVMDFAEYGVVKEGMVINVPMNCKRTFSNTSQPMLFLKIQAFEKNNRARSSSGDSLVREGSIDRNCSESLMNEENVEEIESASITDDDVSSSNGSSNPQKEKEPEDKCGSLDRVSNEESLMQDKSVAESVTQKDEELDTNMRTNVDVSKVNDQQSSNTDESQTMGDLESNILSSHRLKTVKSGHSLLDSGSWKASKDGFHGGRSLSSNGRIDMNKLQQLQHRVQNLESELKEAAAIEVGLYSIVAEHGSSISKVHAPARRLSRLYLHACKQTSQRASSSKSIVSGLILVAKACGNDVPRLTFWLSNCVVLRAIIYDTFEQDHISKKKESSTNECKLISAIEKVESWIFSRIIESVWWQTLTPYMQSTAARAIVRIVDSESNKKTSSSRDQEQANFSMELWKTAFMDACERLCPVRAGGHDCGCLPVLSRLVMEQCMARLDVAMFNAILRESADEVPTDPVSDPISDARVLPISSGKASFGAGAQLKNAIGNWSRWLTDLFGIDDDDDNGSFKSFHLLNALSDLMMLPKDMLLDSTIRKEVCPTFGAPLIKGILDTFVPDEFCPDAIPQSVLKALDSEEEDSFEGGVRSVPCTAGVVVYDPPSASSIRSMIILGDGQNQKQLSRSGSVLRKSNTSDDELDELSSPLTAIIGVSAPTKSTPSSWRSKSKSKEDSGGIRYQLLKEVWMNSE